MLGRTLGQWGDTWMWGDTEGHVGAPGGHWSTEETLGGEHWVIVKILGGGGEHWGTGRYWDVGRHWGTGEILGSETTGCGEILGREILGHQVDTGGRYRGMRRYWEEDI